MNYGNEPVYDLQASSYAYKMRIWLNDQIWNVKIMCIPSISNNLYNLYFDDSESGWSCRTWLLSDWY